MNNIFKKWDVVSSAGLLTWLIGFTYWKKMYATIHSEWICLESYWYITTVLCYLHFSVLSCQFRLVDSSHTHNIWRCRTESPVFCETEAFRKINQDMTIIVIKHLVKILYKTIVTVWRHLMDGYFVSDVTTIVSHSPGDCYFEIPVTF